MYPCCFQVGSFRIPDVHLDVDIVQGTATVQNASFVVVEHDEIVAARTLTFVEIAVAETFELVPTA